MIFNPRIHSKVFDYDFLKVGDTVRFMLDEDGSVHEGEIIEMFVERANEEALTVIIDEGGEEPVIGTYDARKVSFEGDEVEDEEDDEEYQLIFPVKAMRLVPDAVLPVYSSPGASGMDFFALEDVYLAAGAGAKVGTGIALELPAGFELQLRSRSSMRARGIIGTDVGTIDNDYRGEIVFVVRNAGSDAYMIKKGDKIGQGVLAPIFVGEIQEVDALTETVRGDGGFGSTGR